MKGKETKIVDIAGIKYSIAEITGGHRVSFMCEDQDLNWIPFCFTVSQDEVIQVTFFNDSGSMEQTSVDKNPSFNNQVLGALKHYLSSDDVSG